MQIWKKLLTNGRNRCSILYIIYELSIKCNRMGQVSAEFVGTEKRVLGWKHVQNNRRWYHPHGNAQEMAHRDSPVTAIFWVKLWVEPCLFAPQTVFFGLGFFCFWKIVKVCDEILSVVALPPEWQEKGWDSIANAPEWQEKGWDSIASAPEWQKLAGVYKGWKKGGKIEKKEGKKSENKGQKEEK